MTPDEERVRRMLDLSQELRHADTALDAARSALDEFADQLLALRGRDLPPVLGDRIAAASERVSYLIRRRDVLLVELEALSPSVPVRVYSRTDLPRHATPEGSNS